MHSDAASHSNGGRWAVAQLTGSVEVGQRGAPRAHPRQSAQVPLAPLFMPVPIDDRRGIAGAPPAASNAASVVARAAASAFEKFAIVACFASAAANFLASAAASALEKLAVAAAAAAAFDISAEPRRPPTAAAAAAAADQCAECRCECRWTLGGTYCRRAVPARHFPTRGAD